MARTTPAGDAFDDFLTFAAACLRKGRVDLVSRSLAALGAGTGRGGAASSRHVRIGRDVPTGGLRMIAALTGAGLSAAAGLNAYIPFLLVALVARFTDVITLPQSYAWIESWWAIGIGAVLLLAEVVLHKVPAVDSVNDAIQTFIRPSMGGLIFAATSAASDLDHSTWMTTHPFVGVVLGIVFSGLVHTGKMAARPAINAGTLGFGAPVVSTVEDGASF